MIKSYLFELNLSISILKNLILFSNWCNFALVFATFKAFKDISIDKKIHLTKEDYSNEKAFNSFEVWIRNKYSSIDEIFKELEEVGTPKLSGTGSTIFLEYDSLEEAQIAHKEFPELVLTKSLDHSPLMQIIE